MLVARISNFREDAIVEPNVPIFLSFIDVIIGIDELLFNTDSNSFLLSGNIVIIWAYWFLFAFSVWKSALVISSNILIVSYCSKYI